MVGQKVKITQMQGKFDILTASKEKIIIIWKEHFQELLNQGEPMNEEDMDHAEDLDPQEERKLNLLNVKIAI